MRKSYFFSLSAQIINEGKCFPDISRCTFIIFSAVYSQRGRLVGAHVQVKPSTVGGFNEIKFVVCV